MGKETDIEEILFSGNKSLCSPKALAKLFNFSGTRRVEQLTQDGVLDAVLVKIKGREVRRYDLAPTIQKYINYLSGKAYGKARSAKEAELKEQKLEAEIALKESQGELHRLKTQIAAGDYISVEEVRLDYARFFLVFKKFAMSLPSRVGGLLSGQLEPLEARRIEKEMSGEIASLLESFVVAGIAGPKEAKGILNAEKKKMAQEVPDQPVS